MASSPVLHTLVIGISWSGGSPVSLGHGDTWFKETVLLLCGLLHHLCTGSDWDGHHSLLATFLALETVAQEQGGGLSNEGAPLARGAGALPHGLSGGQAVWELTLISVPQRR